MKQVSKLILTVLLAVSAQTAFSHGDTAPQAVDVSTLPPLGEKWREDNPYRKEGNGEAVRVGLSAYTQNCARCHGIEAVSGGIAPDLRKLDADCMGFTGESKTTCIKDIDNYFLTTLRKGRVRNGAVYMPPFEGILQQEAMWAIKAYLETRREK
jgi:cytochrome c-550 PedF